MIQWVCLKHHSALYCCGHFDPWAQSQVELSLHMSHCCFFGSQWMENAAETFLNSFGRFTFLICLGWNESYMSVFCICYSNGEASKVQATDTRISLMLQQWHDVVYMVFSIYVYCSFMINADNGCNGLLSMIYSPNDAMKMGIKMYCSLNISSVKHFQSFHY